MTAAKTIVRTKLGRQGVGLRVHKIPTFWYCLLLSATVEFSNFKFGTQLEF